jgi:signal transduction histidine kinase
MKNGGEAMAEIGNVEERRIVDLQSLEVLDTPRDPAFDQVVELAAAICGTSMAAVSLVDRDRQWFKSILGLAVRETSREVAFCDYTIRGRGVLIVEDASRDERFSRSPLVTGPPGLRFYAGVPLVTERGNAVGALCVLDTHPNQLTDNQVKALAVLGRQVVLLLESRVTKQRESRMAAQLSSLTADFEAQRSQMAGIARMSALGQMASGIAHEINNPLAIIRSSVQLLCEKIGSGDAQVPKIVHSLRKIDATAVRIAKIIKSLRMLARDEQLEPFSTVSTEAIISDSLEFCRSRFVNHGVSLVIGSGGNSQAVQIECRPVALVQVLLNLLNNAFDAVFELDEKWVSVEIIDLGQSIELRVTDSGSGIAPELRERIMQPFFTTKEVGKGTGLGLSLVKSMVESHHGSIDLDLRSRHTRFVVTLPKLQPEAKLASRAG